MALLDWTPPEADTLLLPRLLPRPDGPYRVSVQAWPHDEQVPEGYLVVAELAHFDDARRAAHEWMQADPFDWRLLGGGTTVELYGVDAAVTRSLRIGRRA